MRYLSTFISGLDVPILEIMAYYLKNPEIISITDGAVVYETNEDIHLLKCMNNTFIVLDDFVVSTKQPMENAMNKSIAFLKGGKPFASVLRRNQKTFRLVTSEENNLVSIDNNKREEIERFIYKKTGLVLKREKADAEFWIYTRSEHMGYLLLRQTKTKSGEKNLSKGELRKELCYIMHWISEPRRADIFLDPFCGYGAIPAMRQMEYPCKKIIAADISKKMTDAAKNKLKADAKLQIITTDISKLDKHIEDGQITKIVTDPPWGIYDKEITDIEAFYKDMLVSFKRMMIPNGQAVILTAKKDELKSAVKSIGGKITAEHNILVSGKKAGIYRVLFSNI